MVLYINYTSIKLMTKTQQSTEVITQDKSMEITYYLLEKDLKRLLPKKKKKKTKPKQKPTHCQENRKAKGVFLLPTLANF